MKLLCFALPAYFCMKQGVFPGPEPHRNFSGMNIIRWPKADRGVAGNIEDADRLETLIGKQVTVVPELAACQYGEWSGRSLKAVPTEDLSLWLRDPEFVPPGGESRSMVIDRVAHWFRNSGIENETVILIVDADIVRILVLICLGLDVTLADRLDILPSSWSILSYVRSWRLQALSLPPDKVFF